jgi:UDP-N-acetylmuramoyl-L-alanyl-D-glutamate--2,6-diaminopimelate ligase
MSKPRVPQVELDRLSAGITTVAVTGTNGKTTTTSMIAAIARAAGRRVACVTTLGMWVEGRQVATDGSMDSFVRTVRLARAEGADLLALEVTSRALAGGFAERWPAHVAVFTNLTPDHLDRHGTPEAYLAAKAQLFARLRPEGTAVLNAADPASALLEEVLPADARVVRYLGSHARGASTAAGDAAPEIAAETISTSAGLTHVKLSPGRLAAALGGKLQLAAAGDFNVDNALAAALACEAASLPPAATSTALGEYAGEPGRFQIVARRPVCIVDFAHTPDALRRVLTNARALVAAGPVSGGRLICVMGCGGERDPSKRGPMGEIADALTDQVWLTTDNPRGEDAARIAAQVHAGARGHAHWVEEPDRRAAIRAAVHAAADGDVVLVAGRGHEAFQDLGHARISGSDEDWLREALARR